MTDPGPRPAARDDFFDLALPYTRDPGEPDQARARARAAEELGVRALWCSDDWYGLDAFAALAAVGQHCSSPKLGVGVTNPFSRHLVQLAAGALTVDRYCGGGRVILTLGRSARYGVEHLGLHYGSATRALRDAVLLLKRLLAGEEVTARTEHFQMHDHRMTWPIPERPIPVYLAAVGETTLRLAGEVADGVLLVGFTTTAYCRWAMEQVRIGAEQAGRDPGDVDVVCPQAFHAGEVPDFLLRAMVPMIATMCMVPGLARAITVGADVPDGWADDLVRACRRDELFARGDDLFGAFVESGAVDAALPFFPDELVRDMSLCGSDDLVARKLADLRAMGIGHVSLTPTLSGTAETVTRARELLAAAG